MTQTTRTSRATVPPEGNGAGRDESRLKDLHAKAQLAITQYRELEEALRGPSEELFDPKLRAEAKEKPKTDWTLPQPMQIVERSI